MASPRQTPPKSSFMSKLQWRHAVFITVIGLFVYVVASQIEKLRQGFVAALTSNLWLVSMALLCIVITYFSAAGLYWALCQRKIRYRELWLVELATGFSSRLLPVSIGGIAVNVRFLHHRLQKKTHSAAIVGLNNIIGFVSYVSLGLFALVVSRQTSDLGRLQPPRIVWLLLAVIGAVLVVALGISKWARSRVAIVFTELRILLADYAGKPSGLMLAYGMALGTTIFYVSAFYLCVLAVGAHITALQAVVIFALGLGGGAIAPTPGGLGGVEAGLYTGLYAAGVPSNQALSAVLLYRLLSYWLPMIPGFFVFRHLLKQKTI